MNISAIVYNLCELSASMRAEVLPEINTKLRELFQDPNRYIITITKATGGGTRYNIQIIVRDMDRVRQIEFSGFMENSFAKDFSWSEKDSEIYVPVP